MGLAGPGGPSAVSANTGNQAVLGSDSLIFVPHDNSKYDASNPTGYITAAAVPVGSSTPPAMDGTAAAGTQSSWSRGDHVHPSDTSRVPMSGGTMTGQLNRPGTTAADNTAAGQVGEQIAASLTTSVPLTSATTANVGSMSLTPGDWTVAGVVLFQPASNAAPSALIAAVGTASATLPTAAQVAGGAGNMTQYHATFASNALEVMQTGPTRINVSVATTVYLMAQATFSSGTCGVTGYISARRVR